jgi:hypothetical protein
MSVITDKRLDELLLQSPAERITKEYMDSRIRATSFLRMPMTPTVTVATIELDNGYSVRGESACVNIENYNQEIGEKVAYDNAYSKLWSVFGFLLAEKNFIQKKGAE